MYDLPGGLHREDLKAALRKRFGSIQQFERDYGLPAKSVSDLMRGRTSKRVAAAIGRALAKGETPAAPSEFSDDTDVVTASHRLKSVT